MLRNSLYWGRQKQGVVIISQASCLLTVGTNVYKSYVPQVSESSVAIPLGEPRLRGEVGARIMRLLVCLVSSSLVNAYLYVGLLGKM